MIGAIAGDIIGSVHEASEPSDGVWVAGGELLPTERTGKHRPVHRTARGRAEQP
jgi:hypothetical protein